MKRIFVIAALLGAAIVTGMPGRTALAAENYPDRPIRWVIPYPAGAPTDIIGRKLADVISRKNGWKLFIENKTGAGGTIGAADVAKSPANGYSFLVSTGDALISAPIVLKITSYNPRTDFAFVSQIASAGYVMIVGPQLEVNNLQDLIEKVRATPAGWNIGVTGPGAPQNLVTSALVKKTGIRLNPVPYPGSVPAVQDVISKNIEATYTGANVAAPFMTAQKLKGIAMTGQKRSSLLPDVPTFAELGFTDPAFTTPTWIGITAPAGTPANIVTLMSKAIKDAMADPELAEYIKTQGFEIIANNPDEFRTAFDQDINNFDNLINDAAAGSK